MIAQAMCQHTMHGSISDVLRLQTDVSILATLHAAGLLRLVFTRGVDYQQPVGEYGVHWNFFFTLAAVKLLTAAVPIPSTASLYAGESTPHLQVMLTAHMEYRVLVNWLDTAQAENVCDGF